MSHSNNEAINPLLAEHIEAARTIDESELADAIGQFRSTLPEVKAGHKPRMTWLRLAGAAAMLAVVVSLVPLLVPGKPGASAFAQTQAWFESYRTFQFIMTLRQNGNEITTIEVWSDESGNTRVDTPPVSHIVLPAENVMHTVMPGGQVMSNGLGLGDEPFTLGEEVEWLDELLEFQGLARIIDETRNIEGIDAMGWQLELPGGTHTLWADPADNRPLLLDAELEGGVTMESKFIFDEQLPDGIFDLPSSP